MFLSSCTSSVLSYSLVSKYFGSYYTTQDSCLNYKYGSYDYLYSYYSYKSLYSYYNYYYDYYLNKWCSTNFDLNPVNVSVLEENLKDIELTYGADTDTTYCGQLSSTATGNVTYCASGVVGLKISTTNTELVTAIATGDLNTVKTTLLEIVAIPEVQIALTNSLDAVEDVDVNTLLAQIQSSTDISTVLALVSDILGLGNISLVPTATGMELIITDTSALQAEGLLNVVVNSDGTYKVTSPLFDHLSVDDTATVTFGYSASNGYQTKSSTVTLEVIGTNDAPIINELCPVLTTLSEDDFKTLAGYENAYYVISQEEILSSLQVTDVDVLDNIEVLITDNSALFSLNGTDVTSSSNGVFQLTQDDIDYFGLTGVSVGDFFVYSTEFDSMGANDSTVVSFQVSAYDGTDCSECTVVSFEVKGSNDALEVCPITVSVLEEGLEDIALTYGSDVDTTYHGQLTCSDVDVNDTVKYSRVTENTQLKITTINTALVTAIATGDLDYVKATLLEFVAIPEIQIALTNSLNAVVGLDVNTLLAQIQTTTDITTALGLVSNVLGLNNIDIAFTTTGMDITINDTTALEAEELLNIVVAEDGSYTVISPLFNHLSVDDTATVTFGYSATDGTDTQTSTVTLEVIGTNDYVEAELAMSGTEQVLNIIGLDPDINDDDTIDFEALITNNVSLSTSDLDIVNLASGYTVTDINVDTILDITDSDNTLEFTGDISNALSLDLGTDISSSSDILSGDTQWHKDITSSTSTQEVYVAKSSSDELITLLINDIATSAQQV